MCVWGGGGTRVDLIRGFIGMFVFQVVAVPSEIEIGQRKRMPEGDISVVCIDGFELLRKV